MYTYLISYTLEGYDELGESVFNNIVIDSETRISSAEDINKLQDNLSVKIDNYKIYKAVIINITLINVE